MDKWSLIPKKKMPPTRLVRYCCSELKESGCRNRMIATGVRWDESSSRKSREAFEVIGHTKKAGIFVSDEKMLLSDNEERRSLFEHCELKAATVVNPIIDWTDKDIWEFIRQEHLDVNPLYQCGYDRVGCIGCPMAGRRTREKEFADFPKYKRTYIKAFERMLEAREARGLETKWKTGEEVFHWWMGDQTIPGQITIEEYLGSAEEG